MHDKVQFWSLIAVGEEDRQYGGNPGYDDDFQTVYEYDNKVQNSLRIQTGDVVFLRDKDTTKGIAVIEIIESRPGKKELRRCPACKKVGPKPRIKKRPKWRCTACRAEFPNPVLDIVPVTKFKAHFGSTYVPIRGHLPARFLKEAAYNPNDQASMEAIDPTVIEFSSVENSDEISQIIAVGLHRNYHIGDATPLGDEGSKGQTEDDEGTESGYIPGTDAKRKKVLQQISERRGQPAFRKKLIKRFGSQCVISGCLVLSVVEAAHIRPYVTDDDNHPENGLLLRSDLHTLVDLDLLGIEPNILVVQVHPELRSGEYGKFHGTTLDVPGGQSPSEEALALRWNVFVQRSRRPLLAT